MLLVTLYPKISHKVSKLLAGLENSSVPAEIPVLYVFDFYASRNTNTWGSPRGDLKHVRNILILAILAMTEHIQQQSPVHTHFNKYVLISVFTNWHCSVLNG